MLLHTVYYYTLHMLLLTLLTCHECWAMLAKQCKATRSVSWRPQQCVPITFFFLSFFCHSSTAGRQVVQLQQQDSRPSFSLALCVWLSWLTRSLMTTSATRTPSNLALHPWNTHKCMCMQSIRLSALSILLWKIRLRRLKKTSTATFCSRCKHIYLII